MEASILGRNSDEDAVVSIDRTKPILDARGVQRDRLFVACPLIACQRERPNSRRLIISDGGLQSRAAGPISLYSRLVEMIPTAIVCAA